MPPKLSSLLPHLPKPPRLSSLLRERNPVRDILDDTHELLRGAREEIRSVASVLHVDRPLLFTETKSVNTETRSPSSDTKHSDSETVHVEPARVTVRVQPVSVTDAQTLQYQHDGLIDELQELETRHLPAGGKIYGLSCDCIAKHARAVKRLAKESIPIAARQGKDPAIYTAMVEWAGDLEKIGTKVAVDSGEYAERYATESGTASKYRKALESGGKCPTCNEPKRLAEFLKKAKDA